MSRARHLAQLQRLETIAGLLKDGALSDLARASQACEATRQKLRDLAAPMPAESSLPVAALEQAALRYQRWSEPRRMQLNEQLALQIATRLECERIARRSLGRAEVIGKLASGAPRRK